MSWGLWGITGPKKIAAAHAPWQKTPEGHVWESDKGTYRISPHAPGWRIDYPGDVDWRRARSLGDAKELAYRHYGGDEDWAAPADETFGRLEKRGLPPHTGSLDDDDDDFNWDDEDEYDDSFLWKNWYHASPHELAKGTVLTPGGGESPFEGQLSNRDLRERGGHVWVTDDLDDAHGWRSFIQDGTDKPVHLYRVQPYSPPHFDADDTGHSTDAATVMEKVYDPTKQPPPHTAAIDRDVAEDLMRLAMPAIDAYDDDEALDENYEPIPGSQMFPMDQRSTTQEIQPGPYYHASPHDLPAGHVLLPRKDLGLEANPMNPNHANWVWMSRHPQDAAYHLDNANIYEVEPLDEGPWKWNKHPDWDDAEDGGNRYVSPRARIIRKLDPNEHHTARLAMPMEDAYDSNWPDNGDVMDHGTRPDKMPNDIPIFPGPWFHGTDTEFQPGDILSGQGGKTNRSDWTFMTDEPGYAGTYGQHIYQVEPLDEGPYPWNGQTGIASNHYVSPRARVIRKIDLDDEDISNIRGNWAAGHFYKNHYPNLFKTPNGWRESHVRAHKTAGPRRRFNQDWQQVGFDLMPVDAVAHYMQRKETGFGDEKAPLYELNKQPPLSEQIKQRGYEKPVHLVTDGRSGSIYDGHHRIDIARQLGHSHVPVEVSWRTPNPDGSPMFGDSTIEPWLKGWLTDMRQGRETVGRRIAAQDPKAMVDRLRSLNHRYMIHRSRTPAPDRVIAQHPPLSAREEQERQKLSDLRDDLKRRWDNMDPMTEQDLALHQAFHPAEHRYDNLEAMTDREKARHYSDLSNGLFMSGGRTKREQSQYERLTPWADHYFGGMHEQARHELNRWQDYHDKGYHWNGNFSLEGQDDAHEPHNTVDWGAEMTRMTADRTPARRKLPTNHFLELAAVAREHHAALKELATHGPLYYNPDRASKPYAHEYADDTRNRLRAELQHKGVFAVPDISQLSKITNPKEMHADDDLVNPRHAYGIAPHAGYRTEAEQRAYKINCQRCILAAEARHRGYNVEAQRNFQPFKDIDGHPENDQTFDDHQIALWFQNKDGSIPTWIDPEDDPAAAAKEPIPSTDKPTHLWDHMHEQIASWGPGARGAIAVTYKSKGGQTKRHVLSVKVHDNGKVHYYDTQTHETGQDQYWRDKIDYEGSNTDFANMRYDGKAGQVPNPARAINRYHSPLRYMRLDDKDLSPHAAKHMVDRGTAPDEAILPTTNVDF